LPGSSSGNRQSDDFDEAGYIVIAMPPEGIISTIDMEDLIAASEIENEAIN